MIDWVDSTFFETAGGFLEIQRIIMFMLWDSEASPCLLTTFWKWIERVNTGKKIQLRCVGLRG